jgi:hypothetical protein
LDALNETFLQKTAQCSCTDSELRYSPNPQRKTRAEKEKIGKRKAAHETWNQKRSFKKTQKQRNEGQTEFLLLENRKLNCALCMKMRRHLWFKQMQSIEFVLKRDGSKFLESLILAQNERWRRG